MTEREESNLPLLRYVSVPDIPDIKVRIRRPVYSNKNRGWSLTEVIDLIPFCIVCYIYIWSLLIFISLPGILSFHIPHLFRISSTPDYHPPDLHSRVGRSHGPMPQDSLVTLNEIIKELGIGNQAVNKYEDQNNKDRNNEGRQLNNSIPFCFMGSILPMDNTTTNSILGETWRSIGTDQTINKQYRENNNIRVFVTRILGNDLPPIHGVNQLSNNYKHVLEYDSYPVESVYDQLTNRIDVIRWNRGRNTSSVDTTSWDNGNKNTTITTSKVNQSKHCQLGVRYPSFNMETSVDENTEGGIYRILRGRKKQLITVNRMSMINRIIDYQAYRNITNLVDIGIDTDDAEPVVEVPYEMNLLLHSSNPSLYTTNQNRARNWIIQESIALGADWIMALDGNIFLTRESYLGALRGIIDAESSFSNYLLLPYYRLALDTTVDHVADYVNHTSTISSLFYNITRHEPQLSFRSSAPFLFDDELAYGQKNKYQLIKDLHSGMGHQKLQCSQADSGFDFIHLDPTVEDRLIRQCGYTIRLGYWSEYNPLHGSASDTIIEANRRSRTRMDSNLVLARRLADMIGTGLFDEYRGSPVLIFGLVVHVIGVMGLIWIRIKYPNICSHHEN